MLEPLELQVFPSSYNCISWSEDGEIALATGEYVQVLTPKAPPGRETNGAALQFRATDWHQTRFRANVFTVNEWPIMYPQPRDQFSIGVEQSMSTVVSVAWSPPGLVKHRRSVLAVLTSNQVLSIYAYAGNTGKWTRVAIANKALEAHFGENVNADTPKTRKSSIRSFSWTPPLNIPAQDRPHPGPESRWGIPLLAVTTDANDVAFVRLHTVGGQQESPNLLRCEIISIVSLHDVIGYDQKVQPHSLFASALRSESKILSLASGPWLYEAHRGEEIGTGVWSAVLNVAGVQGTRLRVAKLSVGIELRVANSENDPHYNLSFSAEENVAVLLNRADEPQLTGPVEYIHQTETGRISIAVGAVAALIVVGLSENAYRGQAAGDGMQWHAYPLSSMTTDSAEQTEIEHYERISGMTVAMHPELETPILHFGTVGGYSATKAFVDGQEGEAPWRAPWKDQIEDIRERFDIDRDLGGLAISRLWGLTSIQGLVAIVVTLHPGDMVEYRTSAEDRMTILFCNLNGQPAQTEDVPFLRGNPTVSPEFLSEHRDVVLRYILRSGNGAKQALSPKVLYAAACCATVQSHSEELLSDAREVLQGLAAAHGVDMADEIAKCSEPGSFIDAKPAGLLDAANEEVFERCDVCGSGISWDSAQEAQCGNGHVFVRCSLTFLAIQEPGISKFCSRCDSEYLDEDLIGPSSKDGLRQSCKILSDIFDTCIYCNGKFRP
ncbi:transcription factor IIIC subunit delta N-term-domain-containing protein [Aspergillus pseudoustus]|uniref:Transcription factor IIIC subunit delta N-term-domain-containing protein n=1 Tax=Aspergillus pseudoustus TaxID=1810923 RepID=A0ABR4JF66_9EURO